MSEKTGLRKDLGSEVGALVASDAPDEEVLNEVVRRVHEAHPVWDWSGIYLLVGDTLVLGPRTAPVDHSRIAIGRASAARLSPRTVTRSSRTCARSRTTWRVRSTPAPSWSS